MAKLVVISIATALWAWQRTLDYVVDRTTWDER